MHYVCVTTTTTSTLYCCMNEPPHDTRRNPFSLEMWQRFRLVQIPQPQSASQHQSRKHRIGMNVSPDHLSPFSSLSFTSAPSKMTLWMTNASPVLAAWKIVPTPAFPPPPLPSPPPPFSPVASILSFVDTCAAFPHSHLVFEALFCLVVLHRTTERTYVHNNTTVVVVQQ